MPCELMLRMARILSIGPADSGRRRESVDRCIPQVMKLVVEKAGRDPATRKS
jgi:hypothetical protein